ncbi:MAG: hypothetical protein F6K22_27520 [Okeania sp. SIO2F4]|uniref:hypothetical protein n=1 Tax=Okeania sp. SIO2F4 TaxID=2607790 RepID=UPI00142B8202|nr:hypothetical protein [Okeania sp. SIO2F4]NES06231.1 hypothetical protein [Okeania sp. SIO2F4]
MRLSKFQTVVLNHLRIAGYPLTLNVIAKEISYSKSLVISSLIYLERMGVISVVRRQGVSYYCAN